MEYIYDFIFSESPVIKGIIKPFFFKKRKKKEDIIQNINIMIWSYFTRDKVEDQKPKIKVFQKNWYDFVFK